MDKTIRFGGLWAASAPAAPPSPPLRRSLATEVAIIGAGFTGLSAALHLAERGIPVVVLEAEQVGFGGSGRNAGLVNAGMWVMPSVVQERLGNTYGQRLLRQLGTAPAEVYALCERHAIECEAVPRGTLHCAVGAAGLRQITDRARQWQHLGARVELLDAAQAARAVGTTAYAGALLDHRAGTIQPLAYARGLARAAITHGAAIHAGSRVRGVTDAGDRWVLEVEGGQQVSSHWVIVATNAYTELHGALWPQLREELVHFPYFNLATAPLPDDLREGILPGGQGAWDTRTVLSHVRLDQAGRLILGSAGALSGAGRKIHPAWGRRALARLFPRLKDVPFEHEWYGCIGMTDDALPRFHQLARNVVSFSGYNGRGIAPGTVFGRELARLAAGEIGVEELPLPVTSPQPAFARTVKETFYRVGAELAHAVDARG